MKPSLFLNKHATIIALFFTLTLELNAQVWQQLNGPTGGVPNSIVTGPGVVLANFNSVPSDNPDLVVYRTDDNGQNWIKTVITRPILGIDSSGFYYSVTTIANDDPDTLFRSTDEGNTWVAVFTDTLNISGMLVADNGKLYFHGPAGLIMSANQGEGWSATDTNDCSIVALNSQGHIMRVSTDELLVSQDDGNTWEFFMDISFTLVYGWWVTNMVINSQDEIFLGTRHYCLYKIAPDGSTWEEIIPPPDGMYYIYDLEISPTGALVVLSHPGHVHTSADNGVTWYHSYNHELLGSVEINADNVIYAVGSEGIYTSGDLGVSWAFPGNGLLKSSILKVETLNENTILASTNEVLYRSDDGGNTWQYIFATSPNGYTLEFYITSNGDIFTIERQFVVDWKREAWDSHYMYRSSDGGVTWNEVFYFNTYSSGKLIENPQGVLFMSIVGAIDHEVDVIATSTDNGITWSMIPIDVEIIEMAVNPAGILYGRGESGYYRSVDNGVTWIYHAPAEYINPLYQHMQFEISTSGIFYSVYSWAVFASHDSGLSWTMLYNNTNLNGLSFGINGELFISGVDGLHRSIDGGVTWENIAGDLNNIITTEMDNSGRIYASVSGNSLWTSDTWVSARKVQKPGRSIRLYPNPAIGQFTIQYETGGKILPVKFYSQQGRIMYETQIGPSGQLLLNPIQLPSGIYHVKIEDQVRKMVVLP